MRLALFATLLAGAISGCSSGSTCNGAQGSCLDGFTCCEGFQCSSEGVCLAVAQTTGTSSSTSGTGSTSGVLPPLDGGCSSSLRGTELTACAGDFSCACPQTCVTDPGAGQKLCELPCQSLADCPSAPTACKGGTCALNFCFRTMTDGGAPGVFGGRCDVTVPDAGDGTCIPNFNGKDNALFGFCILDGTATGTCNAATPDNPSGPVQAVTSPASSRFPQTDYCVSGDACATTGSGQGTCESFCNPTSSTCRAPNTCIAQDPAFQTWGLCGACLLQGVACILPSDCCSNLCDPVNGCGGCDPNNVEGC
jgi:hypothetical protein